MSTKCPHCPARHRAGPCVAETTGHRRYCELVDPTHPDHDARFIAPVRDASATATGPPAARPPSVAEARADHARIMACRHWSRPCGCSFGFCSFPWRRRTVGADDCRDCLGIARP